MEFIDDCSFLFRLKEMLDIIEREEIGAIESAAEAAYRSITNDGLLHVFSTGHSHMIVEEMFYRCGGLIAVNPILSDELMLHVHAVTSTLMERQPGKATKLLTNAGIAKDDTIIISSNSGINAVPVEAALYAKSCGLTVVCVTSKKASESLTPRHESGKRLFEAADIVIDNHAPLGDGLVQIPGNGQATGGASTFGSLFIAQRIVLKIENLYIQDGKIPPVYQSANLPGGDDFNAEIIKKYAGRIKALS